MAENGIAHLRVLIANERHDRLELLAHVVTGLGHEVIAREIDVKEVGAVTAREQPDVALVGLGLSSEHALQLIAELVREASCPVIALLAARDPAYVHEAAKRGVFAYIIDTTPEELQSAIDITLQRFSEYHNLQGAFGRRGVIEQAKGILMARHTITADRAFAMLRDHSQHNGRKLADLAAAIIDSHLLLLPPPRPATPKRTSREAPAPPGSPPTEPDPPTRSTGFRATLKRTAQAERLSSRPQQMAEWSSCLQAEQTPR
jgi:AmiR/NasT family two-component response regulator